MGLVDLGIGSHQVQTGPRAVVGFDSSNSIVISGSHIVGIALVGLGTLLFITSSLGIIFVFSMWRPPHVRRRWIEIANHGMIVMVTILSLALAVATVLGLSNARKGEGAYDASLWKDTVESAPIYACHTELQMECSGFEKQQCEFDANTTSKSYCPGHFCIDFCKIATDDMNPQRICDPCRETERVSVFDLISCKDNEKSLTNTRGCKRVVNEDLQMRYVRMLTAAMLSFISVVATMTVTFYQMCCA